MVGFQTKLKHGEQARHLPHDPRPRERRVRAARRPAPQHLPQLARRCSTATLRLKADAAAALRRPDHRLRGLCRERRHRPAGRPLRRRRAARPAARRRRRRPRRFGALLGHITGGHIVSDDEPGKRSFQPMNVNFGLFPPIDGAAKSERQAPARQGQDARQASGADRAGRWPTAATWLGLRRSARPQRRRVARTQPAAARARAAQQPVPPPLPAGRAGAGNAVAGRRSIRSR